LHGILLAFERALGIRTGADHRPLSAAQRLIRGALIFQVVTFLWIPFRAQSLTDAWMLLGQMFAFNDATPVTTGIGVAIAVILVSWAWQTLAEITSAEQRLFEMWLPVKAVAYSAVAVAVLIASSAPPRAF